MAGSLVALGARDASAQEVQTRAVDLPKFNPAPPGDRFFGVPSPYAAGNLTLHAAVLLDYAHEPLTLVRRDGDETTDLGTIVSDQLFLHLALNLSLGSRVALSVNMPFALVSRGDDAAGGDFSFRAPHGTATGDLRFGARIRLFGRYEDAFQLGIGGYVWLPTGAHDAYVSSGSVRGQPQLLLGGRG